MEKERIIDSDGTILEGPCWVLAWKYIITEYEHKYEFMFKSIIIVLKGNKDN